MTLNIQMDVPEQTGQTLSKLLQGAVCSGSALFVILNSEVQSLKWLHDGGSGRMGVSQRGEGWGRGVGGYCVLIFSLFVKFSIDIYKAQGTDFL